MTTLLEVRGLTVVHRGRPRGLFRRQPGVLAVDDVSFDIQGGETLGLLGESGSGKSTVARAVLRLLKPTTGSISFLGSLLGDIGSTQLRSVRSDLQAVFQNPYSSLNPARRVGELVGEPLVFHQGLHGRALTHAVEQLLERVGLPGSHRHRLPAELSGGQQQRVAIARAIALGPKLIVCDEATSGLDVSTRNQIITLFEDLRVERGVAYLFIGHDVAVVRRISHRIAVMYNGRLVEIGEVDQVCDAPRHAYTKRLLASVPAPNLAEQRARRAERTNVMTSSVSSEGFASRWNN